MNSKKIIGLVIGISAFILVLAGLAYAYLSMQATNSEINGTALSTGLTVNVEKSVNGGKLIPMNDSDLGSAINYTTPCIDKNGYGACNIYTVTVTNSGSESVTVSSSIKFTKTGNLDNLKWQELYSLTSITNSGTSLTGATNGIEASSASTTDMPWRISDNIGANSSKTYYIAVWISNNTSSAQNSTDSGSYNATVTFDIGNGQGIKGDFTPQPVSFAEDSWETIKAAITAGTISNYKVGDTKCIALDGFATTNDNGCGEAGVAHNGFKVRIANKSTPSDCSGDDFSQTACGFVIEFVDIISEHVMNYSDTNVGSWPATSMRTYVNSDIYNALPSALQSVIANTKVVTGYGSSESSLFTSNDKIYLLSPKEVWEDDSNSYTEYDRGGDKTRQLDYYSIAGVTTSSYSGAIKQYKGSNYWWWLRAPYSRATTRYFFFVNSDGDWDAFYADIEPGVAPAFRIVP